MPGPTGGTGPTGATGSGGAGAFFTYPLWVSGQYYGPSILGTNTTQASTNGRMYMMRFSVNRARTIDQIATNVTVAGTATHVARMGIYEADPTTGFPTNPVVDSGAFLVDTTGNKTVSVSYTLQPGEYWLAITAQSGTFVAFSNAMAPFIAGTTNLSSPQGATMMYRDSTAPTSALPTNPTITAYAAQNACGCLVRAA